METQEISQKHEHFLFVPYCLKQGNKRRQVTLEERKRSSGFPEIESQQRCGLLFCFFWWVGFFVAYRTCKGDPRNAQVSQRGK